MTSYQSPQSSSSFWNKTLASHPKSCNCISQRFYILQSTMLPVKTAQKGNATREPEGSQPTLLQVRTPKSGKARRELEKRAPKIVETGKKTLILHGRKTSSVINSVLSDLYHLKKDSAVKFSRRNEDISPFESGGDTSLEFFSHKTDCSIFVFGSHSKKRPDNLVIGRTYDHHVYDLVEVGVENYKPLESFTYDKKLAPRVGTKPFVCFIGEGFERAGELQHLKEVLLDLLRGEVVEKLNLAGLDRVYVCTAISSKKVVLTQCALRLKKSGTVVPRMELVEVGPSMELVVRRHRLPNESLRKEAMREGKNQPKKDKNIKQDLLRGKVGKINIPDQKIGDTVYYHTKVGDTFVPSKTKGVKRERREARMKHEGNERTPKVQDMLESKKAKKLKRERHDPTTTEDAE